MTLPLPRFQSQTPRLLHYVSLYVFKEVVFLLNYFLYRISLLAH